MANKYTTIQDVRVSAGVSDNTNFSDEYVGKKIDMAEGIIDGKLGDIYVLPLEEVPDMLKAIALNLSTAMLFIDQYGDETEGLGIDGQKMFDNTMDNLDLIWKQKVKLRKANGTELLRSSLMIPSGYPNAFSTGSGETCRSFTTGKIF
jgi:phage gp36-like protein